MSESLSVALWITVIGMGLVFAAILVLWGVMALVVHLTRQPTSQETIASEAEMQRKRQAAVAAITVALARELDTMPHEFALPTTPLITAWQAVMRSKMMIKRGPPR
jgi:Na+-transporting methylmalonyl-CoA/oxaloacetate decarboxylase gamma subunit